VLPAAADGGGGGGGGDAPRRRGGVQWKVAVGAGRLASGWHQLLVFFELGRWGKRSNEKQGNATMNRGLTSPERQGAQEPGSRSKCTQQRRACSTVQGRIESHLT